MMSKRVISLLLTLVFVFTGVFGTVVFADGEGTAETAADTNETLAETEGAESEAASAETTSDEKESEAEGDSQKVDEAAAAENARLEKSKAIYESMIEEIGLLKSLEIMNDANELNMTDEITRAQFVRYMLQFLNVEPKAASDGVNTYYVDIPSDYEYYNEITTATSLGLVNGDPYGAFNPNNTIRYQDAVKIIVEALEYGTLAKYRGGYPQGYIAVARQVKLLDDISLGFTENITRKELIRLIFNALNANASESNMDTSSAVSISSSDKLYIEDRFDVVKYKGVVTGTSYTRRLEGEDDLSIMEIDGVEYDIGKYAEFDEENVLGQRVYFYIKFKDASHKHPEDGEIIFVNPIDTQNRIVEVNDENIMDTTTLRSFKYYDENDNEKSINIENAIVFYNGKIDNTATDADLKPLRGSVRAIDNNRDGKYDYVFIKNSVQRVVDMATSETIKYKYGLGEITVPKDDSKILLFRYGAEITVDYLGEWEVMEVMLCKDGVSGMIDVSKKVLEGAVNSVGKDSYTVNGVKYDLADEYVNALNRGHFQAVKPQKNDTCQFILDSRGEVAAMSSTLTAITEYGYLVNAVTSTGLEKTSQLKIYCQYGIMNIFPVSENAKINGRKIDNSRNIQEYFYNASRVFVPQLIKFTRANGIITLIETATDTTGGQIQVPGIPNPDKFTLDYQDTSGWKYDTQSYLVENNYIMLNLTTPIFWVPVDADKNKESLYHYYDSRGSLQALAKTTDIFVYDSALLEDYVGVRTPGCIVLKVQTPDEEIGEQSPYTLASIQSNAKYYVVDFVEETGQGSDGPIYSVTMAGNTVINFEERVYNVDTNNLYGQGSYTLANLEKGDIVQIGYGNDSSKANRFLCIRTAKGNGDPDTGYTDGNFRWWNNKRTAESIDIVTNAGTDDAFVVGEIVYVKNPYYVIRTKNAAGDYKLLTLIYSSGLTTYMFEKSTDKIWQASYWEYTPGQRCIIKISNGAMSYAVLVTE